MAAARCPTGPAQQHGGVSSHRIQSSRLDTGQQQHFTRHRYMATGWKCSLMEKRHRPVRVTGSEMDGGRKGLASAALLSHSFLH